MAFDSHLLPDPVPDALKQVNAASESGRLVHSEWHPVFRVDVAEPDPPGDTLLLHHDGWAAYGRFTSATHQQCVAHLVRRCQELLAGAVGGAVHFPRRVLDLFREAIRARQRGEEERER